MKRDIGWDDTKIVDPAAFRRLCVETHLISNLPVNMKASRLQAAVC